MYAGQPRVGNRKFAAFVEKKLGVENIFRSASLDFHSYPYSPAQLYLQWCTKQVRHHLETLGSLLFNLPLQMACPQ
jgi:hypothetical protein